MFMQHLAREKIVMQDKIIMLKQELQELHVDVDLASFLKSIQESDNHSVSTATGELYQRYSVICCLFLK